MDEITNTQECMQICEIHLKTRLQGTPPPPTVCAKTCVWAREKFILYKFILQGTIYMNIHVLVFSFFLS